MIYELILKVLAGYSLLLIIVGSFGNLFIFVICVGSKVIRKSNTFKFIAAISLTDTLSLFGWNLSHFTESYFGIDYSNVYLWYCRINTFSQYTSLQLSAWLLVKI